MSRIDVYDFLVRFWMFAIYVRCLLSLSPLCTRLRKTYFGGLVVDSESYSLVMVVDPVVVVGEAVGVIVVGAGGVELEAVELEVVLAVSLTKDNQSEIQNSLIIKSAWVGVRLVHRDIP